MSFPTFREDFEASSSLPATVVDIQGSTWGGSLLKQGFIGRSMHLEFRHPDFQTPITTSRIVDVRAA